MARLSQKYMLTIIVVLLMAACAMQAPAPPTIAPPATTDAKKILHDMATQLAQAPGFSVTIHSDYEALQADGQRINFAEKRAVQLQRPDHLRIDSLRSDGDPGMILFDGQHITVFKPVQNAYITREKRGSVDDVVIHLVRDLQMTVPLARLLLTTLPQELDHLLSAIAYVEQDVLLDVPTDHLAARAHDVDVQLWVTQGAQRLPRRIVITYKQLPGQPQFRADLDDWNLAPRFAADAFVWTAPASAEKLPALQAARTQRQPASGQGVQP